MIEKSTLILQWRKFVFVCVVSCHQFWINLAEIKKKDWLNPYNIGYFLVGFVNNIETPDKQ